MLILCIFFILNIVFVLFQQSFLAILVDIIGIVALYSPFLRKQEYEVLPKSDNNIIESTKQALKALTQKKINAINFKILKKQGNPYIKELQELHEAMEKQQNKIRKRTRKLHEKNAQNTKLLSAISHEIKNPLSVIQASAETILMQPNIDETMQNKLLNRVTEYSKKINALLNKLTLSQSLEHNVIAVKIEKFDIKILCEEVIEGCKNYLVKNLYKDKTIILEGSNREVSADRILIEQVLNNLIFNAIKYANSKVIVSIKSEFIEIIDDGKGVEKSEINQLTEKFYQGKDAKKHENSLGLGLFIVKEIAKIHNVKVEFLTKRNKKEGLCVRFML